MVTAANNGEDDRDPHRQGVRSTPARLANAVRWEYRASANDLTTTVDISGGWDTTCIDPDRHPADTVLDAESKGAAFKFYSARLAVRAVRCPLRNLTITRGRSDYFDGAAVAYYGAASGGDSPRSVSRSRPATR